VLRRVQTHAGSCASGDATLASLRVCVSRAARETDVDERVVVLLSDANFSRNGITPADLAEAMRVPMRAGATASAAEQTPPSPASTLLSQGLPDVRCVCFFLAQFDEAVDIQVFVRVREMSE
jgi:hypothetical protein